MSSPTCIPRKDLQDLELSIPFNEEDVIYIPPSEKGPLPYKWVGDIFFVKYLGVFRQAESIDFEFPENPL